jgi:acetyltransferase-like isoleucine patch superfamily enzyme
MKNFFAEKFQRLVNYVFSLLMKGAITIKYFVLKPILKDETASYLVQSSLDPITVLKMHGAIIGKNTRIGRNLIIHEGGKDFSKLKIGNNVHIGKGVFIDLSDSVIIEDNCTISMRTTILTHMNVGDSPYNFIFEPQKSPLIIKNGSYVGVGASILNSVDCVAEKTFIAAGSVVKNNTDPNCLYAGVLAKKKKIFF